ncbi:MAG: AMP-binding protein [Jatrophihabitantaceae bacterium]
MAEHPAPGRDESAAGDQPAASDEPAAGDQPAASDEAASEEAVVSHRSLAGSRPRLAAQAAKLPAQLASRAGVETVSALALLRAGAFGIEPPQRLLHVLRAFRAHGPVAAALAIACQRHPTRTAIVDERGALSFAELDDRSARLATALRSRGFRDGDSLGIRCRNHRGMFDALFGAAKLGARTVLLNTDFAGPQLADVCQRERIDLLIQDEEFAADLGGYAPRHGTVLAWTEAEGGAQLRARAGGPPYIETLLASTEASAHRPARGQRIVLLTSGTTGTPKGAAREFGTSLAIPGGYLSRIPLQSQQNVFLAVPVFHAWGLLSAVIALALADTLVLRRRPKIGEVADALHSFRCDTLITVPILLSRLLTELDEHPRELPALRLVAVSGSPLTPDLVERCHRQLGEVLYNLYGSTEVAYASIATPADLAAAPGSVGRPPYGTTVRILDDDGRSLPAGRTGRIFVGSNLRFGGYTGGGGKQQVGGLLATGDLGHLDTAGRLWIDGRDDEMIVSGGENVFPGEVEELLTGHPDIAEAAVLPVPDPDFGQRLRAFVVPTGNTGLDAEQVKAYVREHLARYKVPRDVRFLDALPRNPAGKVVKRELPHD